MVALLFSAPRFERKGKTGPVIKLEGQVSMRHAMNRMEVVNHEPDVLEFVYFDGQ